MANRRIWKCIFRNLMVVLMWIILGITFKVIAKMYVERASSIIVPDGDDGESENSEIMFASFNVLRN